MRRTELDKIDTLEDKIKMELGQLAEKQDQMRGQLETFTNVSGGLRAPAACGAHVCTHARMPSVSPAIQPWRTVRSKQRPCCLP